MLVGMEITSLITCLGHFTRWLSTVHWILARDKKTIWRPRAHGVMVCASGCLTDTDVHHIIQHSFKFHQCNIPRTFNPRHLANTVKGWLQFISIKVLFSHVSLLEMGLWDKYASLFILFPYSYAEAQSHGICNFVCTLTYSTPPKISCLMFRVQSYPALLVAMAWNCSSECNGNNLESLSFLTLCRMLTVCVQRLQLNVSLQ